MDDGSMYESWIDGSLDLTHKKERPVQLDYGLYRVWYLTTWTFNCIVPNRRYPELGKCGFSQLIRREKNLLPITVHYPTQ
jgi:hypothetical protein